MSVQLLGGAGAEKLYHRLTPDNHVVEDAPTASC